MMVYFDTNVLVYAFTKNIDDDKQKDISTTLVEEAIDNNLEFLSTFLQPSNFSINQRMITILKDTNLYISSFDIYHLAFAEYYNTRLFTFDKGFKKLKNISRIEIVIK